ncbi:MAG: sporulation integral membrane protein YtvI [Clostridia bacterium]|nr:sporulation integral membrane protein YtvI [Clostridia bacterium]
MTKTDWHRAASVTVTVLGVIAALYLVGRYALALFCPFLIAFALALLTRPVVIWLSRRTSCPKKVIAALITLLTLVILGALVYALCSRLLIELQKLFVFLIEDSAAPDGQIARFIGVVKGFFQRIPFVEKLQQADFLQYFLGDTEAFVSEQLQTVLSRFSERVTGAFGALLRSLPSLLLFVLVTVISCFYFAIEFETVCRALTHLIPHRFADRVPAWRSRAAEAARRYFRAYFLLFLLTFAQLAVGLIILRVDYVFLIAFLTAVLDILPVLGVGTVLVPFALFSFATGNVSRGIGLLILYGVMTVVRQIAEPHLVGKSLGLHPILMLVSFYAGFKLFGVAGVFLGPALSLLIKALLGSKESEAAGNG